MPLVCLGTGWLIGIALASALRLPMEFLLSALLVPVGGLVLWWKDQRVRLIWLSVFAAILGGLYFTFRLPHFDQNSLSTYNGIGVVTIEGVIDARAASKASSSCGHLAPPNFITAIGCA